MTANENSCSIFAALPEHLPDGSRFLESFTVEVNGIAGRVRSIGNILVGGGDPAELGAARLERFLQTLDHFELPARSSDRSFEAIPETFDETVIRPFLAGQFGRISLIHRSDRFEPLRKAIAVSRAAGIEQIDVDLRFAGGDRSHGDELTLLAQAADLDIDHVSLVETDDAGLDGNEWLNRYESIRALLERAGFRRYEIAHFAREGCRSAHVESVFSFAEVVGIGPGAVSRIGLDRRRNRTGTGDYTASLIAGLPPFDYSESLTPLDCAIEAISLGIRLAKGIDIGHICCDLAQSHKIAISASAKALTAAGWLENVGRGCRLSEKGIPLADKIAVELLP